MFTDKEVKSILCDACRLNIPETRECNSQEWVHFINGQRIPCAANKWRNNLVREGQR